MSKLNVDTIRHTGGSADNITLDNSQNVTVEGNATVDGTSTLTGNVTAAGTLAVTGTSTLTGNVTAGNELHATPSGNANANGFSIIPADGTTASHVKILGNSNSGGASGRNGGVVYIDANYYLGTSTIFDVAGRGSSRFTILGDGTITTNGNSSVPTGSTNGFGFTEDQFYISGDGSGDNYQIRFYNSNGLVGSCMTSGSSTTYNTSSDYRLKENVISLTGAITRLKQLAPKRFNFKANASKTFDGFLAHEAQTVVPEAVSGTKDAVDSDDKIIPQGIDQSKLVPLLTAALQEAITEIETLKTKVAALEAG